MSDVPDTRDQATAEANGTHGGSNRPLPANVQYRSLRVWLRFLRLRLAKAVLLPELTLQQSQALRRSVHKEGALTTGYILMSALSAGIATLGLLQSSTAVVIGAMLVSPLMSPIAALGFGFASIDGRRIRDAARVVAVGAAIGVLTGLLITWLSPIRNATPEILLRTQPTLLDLGVALFSGIAGGYATVIRRGETAIGVAIATALMPPLNVVGYGLAVMQLDFAFGALLLFLTNLAAITFAFAVIARLSGVARPLYAVEWKPQYVAVFIIVFLGLATPLSATLMRVSYEASLRSAAAEAILAASGEETSNVAQLDVSWPLFGEPSVEALVITSDYAPNAGREAQERLSREMGDRVTINLQQVLAADLEAQTRAMVDAAMERTIAGISADVPPYEAIRARFGLPTRSMWSNRAQRIVYVEPVPAPEWTLADYRAIEREATRSKEVWTVRVIPPPQAELTVALDTSDAPDNAVSADLALWALNRWGMSRVTLDAPTSEAGEDLRRRLAQAGIATEEPDAAEAAETGAAGEEASVAQIGVYAPSPARRAAAAAAARAAEADAGERQEATAAVEE